MRVWVSEVLPIQIHGWSKSKSKLLISYVSSVSLSLCVTVLVGVSELRVERVSEVPGSIVETDTLGLQTLVFLIRIIGFT